MMDESIFILIWINTVIFGGIFIFSATLCFYYFGTKNIILSLNESGFFDLANQFNNVVLTIGILRPYGFSKNGKIWDKVWKDFRRTIVPKEFKKLFRYQSLAKSIHFFSIIYVCVFFLLPIFVIFLTAFYKLFLSS